MLALLARAGYPPSIDPSPGVQGGTALTGAGDFVMNAIVLGIILVSVAAIALFATHRLRG